MPEIVAHRGASADAPENTLASVLEAWDQGAPAVEIDVRLTKDDRVILLHDDDTGRVAGEELIAAHTDSSILRRLDAGSWKGEQWKGERIPFLEEVLETIPPEGRMFVEVKSGPMSAPAIVDIIQESGMGKQVTVMSFDISVVRALLEVGPELRTHWIVGVRRDPDTDEIIPFDRACLDRAKRAGCKGVNVSHAGVTAEFVRTADKSGLELNVWTVDDESRARQLTEWGVKGITTNRPGAMLAALDAGE